MAQESKEMARFCKIDNCLYSSSKRNVVVEIPVSGKYWTYFMKPNWSIMIHLHQSTGTFSATIRMYKVEPKKCLCFSTDRSWSWFKNLNYPPHFFFLRYHHRNQQGLYLSSHGQGSNPTSIKQSIPGWLFGISFIKHLPLCRLEVTVPPVAAVFFSCASAAGKANGMGEWELRQLRLFWRFWDEIWK